jgi:hypothetical protein
MWDLLDRIFDQIFDLTCFPLISDPMYRRGFFVALTLALVVGWLSRIILYARGKIRGFFKEMPPSLKSSPSGFNSMVGCIKGVVILAFILVGGVILIVSILNSLSR